MLAELRRELEESRSELDDAQRQLEDALQQNAELRQALAEAGDAEQDSGAPALVVELRRELEETSREAARRIHQLEQELAAALADRGSRHPAGPAPGPPGRPVRLEDIDAFDPQGHKKRMGEILVEAGIITIEQLEDVLGEQSIESHRRFGALAVERGYTTEDVIARILAAQLRLPFVRIEEVQPEPEAARRVSSHLARLHSCMPLKMRENGSLVLAMANPLDLIALEDIELASRCQIEPVVSSPADVDAAIRRHYPG